MTITKVSDEIMAYLELREDNQFSHILPQHYKYYINESIKLGKTEGKKYKGKNLEAILKENEVEVIYVDGKQPSNTSFSMIQSQIYFTKSEKRIELFVDIMEEKQKQMQNFDFNISVEDLKSLHLAHEFYHFLEYKRDEPTGMQLLPVSKKLLGIFPIQAHVLRTSEIAAHQFAKEVCNLSIQPKIMDYCYQIQQGVYTKESFETLILRTKTELEKGGYQ